jgi:hypothetical protein
VLRYCRRAGLTPLRTNISLPMNGQPRHSRPPYCGSPITIRRASRCSLHCSATSAPSAQSPAAISSSCKVAITPEQARNYELQSAPPKPTDRRDRHFNGTETWQAEALDPNDLAEILRDAIEKQLDHDVYRAGRAEEGQIRRELLARFS